MTPRTMQAGFRSSLTYAPEEVQDVLNKKIQEEERETLRHSTPVTRQLERDMHANIRYQKNVLKVVSLFSGAGGLDLGVKLAMLSCTGGAENSLTFLADRQNFEKNTKNIDFIYSNDIFPAANESYTANFGLDVVKDSRDIRQVIEFPDSDLMLGGFPCPGFSAAGPRPGAVPPAAWRVEWRECGDNVQCAMLPVPLDHQASSRTSRTISLGMSKRSATGERRGTIIITAGTQNGGATSLVHQLQPHLKAMNVHYDLVGVDTRGVGRSSPAG